MYLLRMGRLRAGHLPVFFAITFVTMLGVTYVFSVWRGDVDPVFPYISTSGDHRPESCVFSMLLNLCAFFTALIVFLRYSLIVELVREADLRLPLVNKLSLCAGLLGAFGMFIVANFQESALLRIHLAGAFTCFGSGCVYMLLQSWIAYRIQPNFAGRRIAHIRLGIALTSVLCFVMAFSFGTIASMVFHRFYPDLPTPRPWSRKYWPMPGYGFHCASAVAEWTLAILHMVFLLSFSREFEKIHVELSVRPLVNHLDQSPLWRSSSDLTATTAEADANAP